MLVLLVGWNKVEEFYYFNTAPGVVDLSPSWLDDGMIINTFFCFAPAKTFELSEIMLTLSIFLFFFAAPAGLFVYF